MIVAAIINGFYPKLYSDDDEDIAIKLYKEIESKSQSFDKNLLNFKNIVFEPIEAVKRLPKTWNGQH